MKPNLQLAARIRGMVKGESFTVKSEQERQQACRIAKTLRDSGAIEFQVVTKADGDEFIVAAI